MKFKRIISLFLATFLVTTGVSSCGNPNNTEGKIRDIYNLAVKSGYEGTYEEWLFSIRGEDGKDIVSFTLTGEEQGNAIYTVLFNDGSTTSLKIPLPKDGVDGDKGDKGDQGESGSSLLQGNGVPNLHLGKIGDSYIDLNTWDFYAKNSNGWVKKGNIKGEDYVRETHNVKFETGTDYKIDDQKVLHGEKIVEPTNTLTKKGYDFVGWEYEGELWSFIGYTCTSDMTLKARWELQKHNVTIKYNNGSEDEVLNVTHGETINLKTPSKDNLIFDYWYINSFEKIGMPYVVNDNVTIYAKYNNYINVNFNTDGGDPLASIQLNIGSVCNELPNAVKDGFSFIGWTYSNGAPVTFPFTVNNEHLNLKAVFNDVNNDYEMELLDDGNAMITKYKGKSSQAFIPDKLGGKLVTTIASSTFSGNTSIKKVTISDSVNTLQDNLFKDLKTLEEVDFGHGVTNYGNGCLVGASNLKTIHIRNNVKLLDLYDKNEANMIDGLKIIIDYDRKDNYVNVTSKLLFNINNKLFDVELSSFEYVYGDYFYGCKAIKLVKINDEVKNIGNAAFRDCGNLETIIFGKNVKYVQNQAFYLCYKLHTVYINRSCNTFYNSAFEDCNQLRNVYYEGTEEEWNDTLINADNEPLIFATMHYNATGLPL